MAIIKMKPGKYSKSPHLNRKFAMVLIALSSVLFAACLYVTSNWSDAPQESDAPKQPEFTLV